MNRFWHKKNKDIILNTKAKIACAAIGVLVADEDRKRGRIISAIDVDSLIKKLEGQGYNVTKAP